MNKTGVAVGLLLLATVLSAAACPDPTTSGKPCNTDQECPAGGTCVRGLCRPAAIPADGATAGERVVLDRRTPDRQGSDLALGDRVVLDQRTLDLIANDRLRADRTAPDQTEAERVAADRAKPGDFAGERSLDRGGDLTSDRGGDLTSDRGGDLTSDLGGTDVSLTDRSRDVVADSGTAPFNYQFVTSQRFTPDQIGGLGGADALCNNLAILAGLPGAYVAWLSSRTVDAWTRLYGANGWRRTDHRPFAASLDDLRAGRILHPPVLDEYGKLVTSSQTVYTGTRADGTRDTGELCLDWTDSGATDARGGNCAGTTTYWTHFNTGNCLGSARLYCFGVDHDAPLEIEPVVGRVAFLSLTSFLPGDGIDAADLLCQTDATFAALPGSYRALLATHAFSAASRFSSAGSPWVRPDGIPITSTAAELLLGDQYLLAPLNVTARWLDYETASVWTGALTVAQVAAEGGACLDWSSAAGTDSSYYGKAAFVSYSSFRYSGSGRCDQSYRLYCLQE